MPVPENLRERVPVRGDGLLEEVGSEHNLFGGRKLGIQQSKDSDVSGGQTGWAWVLPSLN